MPFDSAPEQQAIPEVHRAEGRRLRPSLKTEAELKALAEEAREKLAAIADRPEEDRERKEAALDFEEKNLDLEIFDLTHDPTGALKREATGVDLEKQFAESALLEKEPRPAASLERITPVFLVNMGELDRLNKEGHDLGDHALTALAGILTDKVLLRVAEEAKTRGVEPESLFQIYRADSNSFMVRFTADIPKSLARELQSALSSQAGEAWEGDLFLKKGVESPPVIADFVSLEEAVEGLPRSVRTSEEAQMRAVGFLKDVLFTAQDARKIVSRAHRLRDLIGAGKEDEARTLYDEFLKKSLSGVLAYESGPDAKKVTVETFEQMVGFLRSADAIHSLWEQAYAKGLADLHARHEKAEDYDAALQAFVAERVRAEHEVVVKPRLGKTENGGTTAPAPVAFEGPSKETATEGLREFARLKALAEQAYENPQEARIAQKRLVRERALRDTATGLELRGSMFKKLEAALEDGGKRMASVSMDMGFLKYFDQVGGRETGDVAILSAAAVFQEMKDAFSKDGIEISVHRLGGDEFGMTVIGDASVSPEDFRAKLAELQKELLEKTKSRKIPPRQGAKAGYFGTELELGVGVYTFDDAAAAKAEDEKYGFTKPLPEGLQPGTPAAEAWIRNQRAEHLVKIADRVMEFQKSTSRLLLVLEKMEDVQDMKAKKKPEAEIAQAEEHLKQLLAFSDKAIFGATGRDRLKEWREKIEAGVTAASLDSEVHAFVWEKMDEGFEKKKKEHQDLESFLDHAVRIKYLEGRVEELEASLGQLTPAAEKQRERYEQDMKSLRDRLATAERDLEEIRSARAGIRAAA